MELFSGKQLSEYEVSQIPPLVLAYVGDSVYEVFVRTYLVLKGLGQVNKLHRAAIDYVSAKSQAEIAKALTDFLSEEEQYVLKRGRNAKSASIPKNADVTDYRIATGFEALIGYIYLKKDYGRIHILFDKILELKEGVSEE